VQGWFAAQDLGEVSVADSAFPAVLEGSSLFRAKGCAACHLDPEFNYGPLLAGRFAGREGETYIRESVRTPNAVIAGGGGSGGGNGWRMPTLAVSDAELRAITAYLTG
jgi:mono/diheme cytochrome c family protein